MHSNKLSAIQWRRNHSAFNAKSVKESVMSISKIARRNVLRTAWMLVTLAPMVMLYNAARAGEPESTVPHMLAVSFRDLNLNSAEGIEVLYKI